MAITFAGKTLAVPTTKLRETLERFLTLNDIHDVRNTTGGNNGVTGYYAPVTPTPSHSTPVRLNTLMWPQQASRYAVFHGLVDNITLDEIKSIVTDSNYAQTLSITDEINNSSISTSMYMLPPHPLFQVTGLSASERQLYLITLVDERYFWWQRVGSLDPLPSSWDDLFSSALYLIDSGLTPNYGTVPISSSYLVPSLKWRQRERPLPLILDAACSAVNRRFVRDLAGNTYIQHWEDAKLSTSTQITNNIARKAMGGEFSVSDLSRVAPEYLRCVFYRPDDTRYTVDRSLASTGITDFGAFTGMPGRTAQYRSETLFIDNLSQATNLAIAAAYDWYGWLLAPTDIALGGIVNYVPNAYADVILWEYTETSIATRVIREPFLELPAAGPENPYETQIIKINSNIRNPDGDFEGTIQMWDAPTNRWVDSAIKVWVKNAN
jgi:hypothetical protein